jgi:hypothetical protein
VQAEHETENVNRFFCNNGLGMPPLAIIVTIALIAIVICGRAEMRLRVRPFGMRKEMSMDKLYQTVFIHKGYPRGKIGGLWTEIWQTLDVPPEKLRSRVGRNRRLGI